MHRMFELLAVALGAGFTLGAAGAPGRIEIRGIVWKDAARALDPGQYDLHLWGDDSTGLTGTLRRSAGVQYDDIAFALRGCDEREHWSARKWSTRGTTRALRAEAGRRRIELKLPDDAARGCALVGVLTLTAEPPVLPARPPDPGKPDQGGARPAPAELPDLVIRTAHPRPGQLTTLAVEIFNHGPGASAATRVKVFYHRKALSRTVKGAVPALAAGQAVWVDVNVGQPLAAATKLTARVDDPNVVPEISEANNGFIVK